MFTQEPDNCTKKKIRDYLNRFLLTSQTRASIAVSRSRDQEAEQREDRNYAKRLYACPSIAPLSFGKGLTLTSTELRNDLFR